MKKLIGLSLVLYCLINSVQAQDATDFSTTALELSTFDMGGTARIQAMGGVGTALGGDPSSAFINPAGLGFYNKSEFSFTPGIDFFSTESNYLGTTGTNTRVNLNIANLSILWNKSINSQGKWHGGSFGININRLAGFNQRYSYEGYNSSSDFIDFSVDSDNSFNGLSQNDFSDLAFNTYLTDEFYAIYEGQESVSINGIDYSIDDLYGTDLNMGDSLFFYDRNTYRGEDLGYPTEDDPTRQFETIKSKGGLYQTSLSYGANYGDKFYFGATIGILSLQRDVERTYTEEPSGTDLRDMVLTDNYTQDGVGVNGTFGVIVRPVAPVLVGLSYTTPSWMTIDQKREISLDSRFNDGDEFVDGIVYPDFQYSVKTPGRLKGGLSVFLGKSGFISADVEHVNYGGAHLSNASDGDFNYDNDQIENYESTINYRIGGEFRHKIFRLRAGYSHLADPTNDMIDNSRDQISLGVGIRTADFFVDLGGVTGINQNFTVSPYPSAELANINSDITRMTVTVGWFF